MRSILQSRKEDYLWRKEYNLEVCNSLEKHHIFNGAMRKVSDRHGFWIWLTKENHTGANKDENPMRVLGVHFNYPLWNEIKADCQAEYEKTHTREQWMKLIGRNYL